VLAEDERLFILLVALVPQNWQPINGLLSEAVIGAEP